ncbi:hypothetical protein GCM10011414_21460 [Croceivirga lutea]|uniref:hypothetical protein n=1 Tax=Croceivirga lutea TaxID=1775167 RepID=UPI0016398D7F|nr:hypothetical protein [Croceivirga lutea]GGG51571.1 hypothetical protein GCM10011414_21460 [Croceivirga lutea]
MQLPPTITAIFERVQDFRNKIKKRRKVLYRRAWLLWPFKFIWVNALVIKRILNYPFKDYKKLSPFSRVVGITSSIILGLFLFIVVKKTTSTDKVIYQKKTYKTFECEVVSNSEKLIEVNQTHLATYEMECYNTIPITVMYASSYGSIVVKDTVQDGKLVYETPDFITQKIGDYTIHLLYGEKSILKDSLQVVTKEENIDFIESYFGPRIILAGGVDFSMLTVVPVDEFDNPMPDNTPITVHENFKEMQKMHLQETFDLVSFKRFYSYNQTGKITVSMNSRNGITTKEKTSDIYPYTPKDFTLTQSKEHNFADGNEVVTVQTSIITDIFGNTVQNGTVVHFQIKTNTGKQLAAYAKTVKGIATTKIQHPYSEESWQIQAFIPGLAQSDLLQIDFEQIVAEFPVDFLNHGRKIKVGPIKSYMGQLVPNGTKVKLLIKGEGKAEEINQGTVGGVTYFILRDFYYPPGDYELQIETLGVQEQHQIPLFSED